MTDQEHAAELANALAIAIGMIRNPSSVSNQAMGHVEAALKQWCDYCVDKSQDAFPSLNWDDAN